MWSRSLKFALKKQNLNPAHRRRQAFHRYRDIEGRDNSGKLPNFSKRYPVSDEQKERANTTDYRKLKFGDNNATPPATPLKKPNTTKLVKRI